MNFVLQAGFKNLKTGVWNAIRVIRVQASGRAVKCGN